MKEYKAQKAKVEARNLRAKTLGFRVSTFDKAVRWRQATLAEHGGNGPALPGP